MNRHVQQEEKRRTSEWREGRLLIDEYVVEKELGRGGMGRVWLVKRQSTGRRFAVKQALIRDDKHRKAFLAELQTWIDLPEHPNIVPCRFFRTIGDEIVIFADYVEGGSLADWIAKGKLTGVEQILDVAIQFAWGLHAIHERGLIHQDVKPGNVLMTPEGVPMVTDFGLARARLRAGDGSLVSPALPPGEQSVLVSAGGMTPAYASPEQRAGQSLSRKTDIWSWGVSLLDMFMGGVSCAHGGQIAADVLSGCLEDGSFVLPDEVVGVLHRCFETKLGRRWGSFAEIVEALDALVRSRHGQAFRWTAPGQPDETASPPTLDLVGSSTGWHESAYWVDIALQHNAMSKAQAASFSAAVPRSRKARLVAELAVYQEVESAFRRMVDGGKQGGSGLLARLCFEKAAILRSSGDLRAAVEALEAAIVAVENTAATADGELRALLPSAYMNQALIVGQVRGREEGIALLDRGIAEATALSGEKWWWRFDELAALYFNKANMLRAMGDLDTAALLYDEAERVLGQFGKLVDLMKEEYQARLRSTCEHMMALLHTNKAIVLRSQGDPHGAVLLYDKAILIREALASAEGGKAASHFLAMVYMNKAVAQAQLGKAGDALTLVDRAISIWDSLRLGGNDQAHHFLAVALKNKASFAEQLQEADLALALFSQARDAYRELVYTEGRNDLLDDLAVVERQKTRIEQTLLERKG